MKWYTPVDLPSAPRPLLHTDAVLLLGSCFTDRIGQRFSQAQFAALSNPFGVLYNPLSIARTLQCLLGDSEAETEIFRGNDDRWYSWLHAGEHSGLTQAHCLEAVRESVARGSHMLRKARWLFVTFGTNRVYYHADKVVSNCHKQPASLFTEKSLTVTDICHTWEPLLERLHKEFPELQVVFTISPYRYTKYGLHGSALSKATLLLAVDALCHRLPNMTAYFPAYEIMLDELRDYRFYESDMLHPTLQASDYVWERLGDWLFDEATRRFAHRGEQISRLLTHRPIHAEGAAYERFLTHLHEQVAQFRRDYPHAAAHLPL